MRHSLVYFLAVCFQHSSVENEETPGLKSQTGKFVSRKLRYVAQYRPEPAQC